MTNPKIDAYIKAAQPFAQPILRKIRTVVHQACPMVQEKMKWGMPHFDYKDQMLCSMAAFQHHAVFGFWKQTLLADPNKLFTGRYTAMGSLGKLTTAKDLPSTAVLKKYIKAAMRLNDAGIKSPANPKYPKKALRIPSDLKTALEKHPKAKQVFSNFSYSHKKEYVEWITDAKTKPTRKKRLTTTLQWLTQGKARHWKY